MKLLIIIIICLIPTGCVIYPKQVQRYDADCKIKYKQLVLEQGELTGFSFHCSNEACIAALLFIPLEALVAGSIVVVGNTAYWLEKEGRCLLQTNE